MKIIKYIKEKLSNIWHWLIDNKEVIFVAIEIITLIFSILIIGINMSLEINLSKMNNCDICHSRLIPISHEGNKVWYQCPNYDCGYGKYKDVNENE